MRRTQRRNNLHSKATKAAKTEEFLQKAIDGREKEGAAMAPLPDSRLVTPFHELPRFPGSDPLSPRLIKRFACLDSSFRVRGFALDAFVLLILKLAPDVHEASALVSISVNCLAVTYVTLERVR